ncbi:MAG: hypothetical protein IJ383_09415 [Bacteroidales bacterium]|nr:hypothetical protein [Bacteroidales bacterium]
MTENTPSLQQLGESPQRILLPTRHGDATFIFMLVLAAVLCIVSLFIIPILP